MGAVFFVTSIVSINILLDNLSNMFPAVEQCTAEVFC